MYKILVFPLKVCTLIKDEECTLGCQKYHEAKIAHLTNYYNCNTPDFEQEAPDGNQKFGEAMHRHGKKISI